MSGRERGLNISLETHKFYSKEFVFFILIFQKLIILVKRSESKASHPEETQTSAKRKRGTFRKFHLFIEYII